MISLYLHLFRSSTASEHQRESEEELLQKEDHGEIGSPQKELQDENTIPTPSKL